MLFPVIKIREKTGDEETVHIVGTNSHDRLYIENNAIHYLDIQCMSGTQHPNKSGMRFHGVETEYSITGYPEIEFVTLEELIDIATQSMKEQTQATINTYEMTRKYLDYLAEQERCKNALDECKGKTGINSDTSGNLF